MSNESALETRLEPRHMIRTSCGLRQCCDGRECPYKAVVEKKTYCVYDPETHKGPVCGLIAQPSDSGMISQL